MVSKSLEAAKILKEEYGILNIEVIDLQTIKTFR